MRNKVNSQVPERKRPASNRTADLPAISSLSELLDFLLSNFGEEKKWQFWLSPEELCDIVEQYADILQVQWDVGSSTVLSNVTYVTLFNKGEIGRNISLFGLHPFPTAAAAKQFCYDEVANLDYLFGQLEDLWGIQGRFVTNFSGKNHSNFVHDYLYKKDRDIDAIDLWPHICRRREVLGISPNP